MKISKLLASEAISISIEMFPPKEWDKIETTKQTVAKMAALHPSFMSVTYGASGGTSDTTVTIADNVQNVNSIPALAHLTCASSSKEKIHQVVAQLREHGIENILALRGDIPKDLPFPRPDQFQHASQLIEEIRALGDFCIGGACYPEGHPEAPSMEKDIAYLKLKQDLGCDFFTSQMFFDNNIFYAFRYRMLKHGIDTPVIAGIMPITNARQTERITALSGTMLPPRFKAIVDKFGGNPAAMQQAGIAYATDQIIDLIANGVRHIHIYSMNRPEVAGKILENLSEIYRG